MRRDLLAVLGVMAVFGGAPVAAVAAPTVTITADCSHPTAPYGVSVVVSGLPSGALFRAEITYASGGSGLSRVPMQMDRSTKVSHPGSRSASLRRVATTTSTRTPRKTPGSPASKRASGTPALTRPSPEVPLPARRTSFSSSCSESSQSA